MANPYVNHVVINGSSVLDLRSDTVDAAHLISGYTAHDKSGAAITGTATGAKVEQTKSVNPTTSVQTVYPDTGKALSAVTVTAIQTETKTATANGTVTPTSGKYLSSVTVAIPVYDGTVS